MKSAECPSCGMEILPEKSMIKIGQYIICPGCETELEIVWLNPLELDWPYLDEDYQYEYYDEEYDEEEFDI